MMDDSLLSIIEKGLRGNNIDDLVEGWSFRIDETSSNLYRVDGSDTNGNSVSNYGVDPIKVLQASIRDAQQIISTEKSSHKLISKLQNFFRRD